MEKSELQIVVSAKDEASATLQKIGSENTKMAKSIFAGVASWDMLKTAVKSTVGFIEDSVGAFIDAEKQVNLTRATLDTMGISFDKVRGSLDQFSKGLAGLGIDNEQASLSVAKLAQFVKGDLNTAMLLTQKAADLTSSGYGDFASNIDNITRILSGKGTRALMEYRVNLSDTASTADQLAAVFGKITLSADQAGNQLPGQINKLKVAFEQAKQEIGKGFMVALLSAFDGGKGFAGVLDTISTAARATAIAVGTASNVIKGIKDFGEAAMAVPTMGVLQALNTVGLVSDEQLKKGAQSAKNSIVNFSKDIDKITSPVKTYDDAVKAYDKSQKEATKSSNDWLSQINKIANTNVNASDAVLKHSDAIKKMGDEYKQTVNKASIDLAELSDNFQNDMASVDESIRSTRQQISSLSADFNRQAGVDASDMAGKIIASEEKIKDLKIQVANEMDTMKRSQLQKQLDDEQKNYDSSAEFRTNNADLITAAETRASMTQLQRDLADYQTRRDLATQEFNQKMMDLNMQLASEMQKKNETIALYNSRKTEISAIMTSANDEYKKLSDERVSMTKSEVDLEIKYFQDLATAISNVKSATKSSVSLTSIPLSARASGGPVSSSTPYLVGEKGPEVFMPSSSGNIISNRALGSVGGGGGISVYLSGTFYTESEVAEKFANQIAKIVSQQVKVRTI